MNDCSLLSKNFAFPPQMWADIPAIPPGSGIPSSISEPDEAKELKSLKNRLEAVHSLAISMSLRAQVQIANSDVGSDAISALLSSTLECWRSPSIEVTQAPAELIACASSNYPLRYLVHDPRLS